MFEMDEDLEGDKAKAAARATAGAQNRSASDAEEDYGDDVITDEDIGRLMIVTSRGGRGVHSRGGGGGSGSGKGLPPRDESANAAINEGLRFYQRELRGGETRGGESWKRGGGLSGAFGATEKGGAQTGSWRGGQHFFPSSFKESGMGSYSGGDDIGWLLGTTPTGDGDAKSRGGAPLGTSAGSDRGGAAASSFGGRSFGASPGSYTGSRPSSFGRRRPPIGVSGSPGSLYGSPRDIPAFQHPSHSLLEDNGFKQQKYRAFYQRCVEERKRLGPGNSEEMNTLLPRPWPPLCCCAMSSFRFLRKPSHMESWNESGTFA